MRDPRIEAKEVELLKLRRKLIDRLKLLPSFAWAKRETARRREKLAAQLRTIDYQLLELRQGRLFPLIIRREDHNA